MRRWAKRRTNTAAPEYAGLDEAQSTQNNVLLGMRAQGSNPRHDLVLHDAVLQPKIVSLHEVAQRLDDISECGGTADSHVRFFRDFVVGNERPDVTRQSRDVLFIKVREEIVEVSACCR